MYFRYKGTIHCKASKMPPCVKCSTELSVNAFPMHWRRFHSESAVSLAKCADCEFAGLEFGEALVHCILHGHSLSSKLSIKQQMKLPTPMFSDHSTPHYFEAVDDLTENQPLFTSQSKRKRNKKTSATPSQNLPFTELDQFTGSSIGSQSSEENFYFTSPLKDAAILPLLDPTSEAITALYEEPLPPLHSSNTRSKSVDMTQIYKEQINEEEISREPAIQETDQRTEETSSANCQQCFKPISLNPKRGAIDHVCACRQVNISDTLPSDEGTLDQTRTSSTSCQQCSTSISLTHKRGVIDHVCACRQVNISRDLSFERKENEGHVPKSNPCNSCGVLLTLDRTEKAVNHVCACHKIKPYGCSSCELLFTQRSNAQRHVKKACYGGQVTLPNKQVETMPPCIQCSAALTPKETSSHWRRFHSPSSPTLFTCPDCGCAGGELDDVLVHCLLHGHGLGSFLKRARENGLPQFLFAGENLDENNADLPDLTTAQSRKKRTRTTSRITHYYSQPNIQHEFEPFISKAQSNEEPQDFTGDTKKTALSTYSALDATSSHTPLLISSPAISPFKSITTENNPENQSRTETTSPPAIPETTEQLYSETCQQCLKPISLHPKRGAIDHVCACRQIKPYGCSHCDQRFTTKGNARRHCKSGACAGSLIALPDREQNEELIRSGLELCFPSIQLSWSGL